MFTQLKQLAKGLVKESGKILDILSDMSYLKLSFTLPFIVLIIFLMPFILMTSLTIALFERKMQRSGSKDRPHSG